MKFVFYGLAALGILVIYMSYQNLSQPKNLGLGPSGLKELKDTPNGVSTQTKQPSKKVEALAFSSRGLAQTHADVLKALKKMPANNIAKNEHNYIHSVFITSKMKFRDDVEIFLDKETKLIHFKSQSRVGYSDKGLNMNRYELFSSALLSIQNSDG